MRADSEGAILADLNTLLVGVALAGPNQPVPAVAPGGKWGQIYHLSVPTVPATQGKRGLNRIGGIVQVSMHYPLNTGDAASVADADAFEARYYDGRALILNGCETILQSCNSSGGKQSGDWFVNHISIAWQSYTTRGE
jgi:hypothetical protein